MANKIEEIEKEIQKIENKILNFQKEKPSSTRDRKIHKATLSLLRNVARDLRKQQKKLTQAKNEKIPVITEKNNVD
jgi:Mg2+ and Co2+ transporter CorA